jgi:hypothetical protein
VNLRCCGATDSSQPAKLSSFLPDSWTILRPVMYVRHITVRRGPVATPVVCRRTGQCPGARRYRSVRGVEDDLVR